MRIFRTSCAVVAAAFAAFAIAQERKPLDPEALVALLRAGNFTELDSRVGAYQAAYEASTDAEWDAVIVFAGFQRIERELETRFDGWVKTRPRSYGALVARAAYFYQRGWSSRGGGFAAETPGGRIDAMQRHFERAERDLKASIALSPRPQLSHRYLAAMAMTRGGPAAARRWHEEALRADPENYATRRAYLFALRPEWGGNAAAMQALLDQTAALPATPKLRAVVQSMKASAIGGVALDAYRVKDYPRALELYAMGLGEAEDHVLLANRALVLRELKRHDEAMRDLDRALALNPASPEAYERRGNLYEIRKQYKEAVRDLSRAASYGRAYAMQRLGLLYMSGKDVPRDYGAAAKWLKLGADLGDARAQSALGWMYAEGAGVPMDGKQALRLWRAAAAQGNEEARKYLENLPWWWLALYSTLEYFSR